MALNYSDYLHLDKILNAQEPKSPEEHDEMLFIIIHQAYELWFKQLLHEGRYLTSLLDNSDDFKSLATLKRMLTVLKTMVGQTDILETMTPISFASFRDRLESASGFQSAQFRIFEFFLGNKDPRKIDIHPDSHPLKTAMKEALVEPTLYDHFLRFVARKGYLVPVEILERDFSACYESQPEIVETVVKIYREDELTSQICERMVDLDTGIQEWRYRHVKMVERTIGNKIGSGGSSGVEFLRKTLFRPAFPELWEARASF